MYRTSFCYCSNLAQIGVFCYDPKPLSPLHHWNTYCNCLSCCYCWILRVEAPVRNRLHKPFTLHDRLLQEVVNFHKPHHPAYRKWASCPAVISSIGCWIYKLYFFDDTISLASLKVSVRLERLVLRPFWVCQSEQMLWNWLPIAREKMCWLGCLKKGLAQEEGGCGSELI